MSEATERKNEFENTKTWLDVGSKAFLILYGIGYFIESYYDSRFGIGYINPLRSKVGFTGIAFGIQVIAAILLFKLEDIVNNSSVWWQASKVSSGARQQLLKVPYVVTWLVECVIIAMLLMFFFVTDVGETFLAIQQKLHALFTFHHEVSQAVASAPASPPPPVLVPPLLALAIPLSFLLMATGGMLAWFTRKPRLTYATMAAVGGGVLLYVVVKIGQLSFPDLFVSFAIFVILIRMTFVLFQENLANLSSRRRAALFLMAMVIPILYAEQIYGFISPQWGGAGTTQVIVDVKFDPPVDPFGPGATVQVLEETDEGFYLINEKAYGRKAIYIPRKDVAKVTYAPGK